MEHDPTPSGLLSELKVFAEEFAKQQLNGYIDYIQQPEASFGGKEINDALWGTIRLSPLEAAILDSPLLQRLRFVKQLGVVHWVYPGAIHTRFDHTLGVLYRLQELLGAVERSIQEEGVDHKVNTNLASVLRLSALLHDVGHGMFSHVSESALDRFDQVRTALIEFANQKLPATPKLSELLAAYIVETGCFRSFLETLLVRLDHPIRLGDHTTQTAERLTTMIQNAILGRTIDDRIPLLHELVSGPFDADKLDYFVRDAKLAGIPSVLDISRLTQKITVRAVVPRELPNTIAAQVRGGYSTYILFGLKWSGAAILDELHLARILLFAKVYRHHKVLAVEAMIESLFDTLATLTAPLQLIKLAYRYTDEHFLSIEPNDIIRDLGLKDTAPSDPALRFAFDILERLRLRRLFVKGFVVQCPFPGDPWGDDKDQQKGLRRFVQALEDPPAARIFKQKLADEIRHIGTLVPDAIGRSFPSEFIAFGLVVSTKPRLTGGTQIDRALVFHGDRIVPYKDLSVNKVAWADAYNFSSASGYIFCSREIATACFVATEKILIADYDVITPNIAIQLSKQNASKINVLKRKLDKVGYYLRVPYEIRPLPERLEKADIDTFVDEMTAKFASVEEPSLDVVGRRPSDLPRRIRAWLAQFRDETHVACAMQIIRDVRVLRREDTKAALLGFLQKHPEFRGAVLCLLGNLKDSSAVQSYFSLDVGDAFSGLMTVEEASSLKVERPVVFLDDILGSGGQTKNMLGHWFDIEGLRNDALDEQRSLFGEVERAYLRERSTGFVFLAGWNDGVKTLSESTRKSGLQSTIYVHVPESKIPFAFERPFQGSSAEATQSFRGKCFDIGKNLLVSKGVKEEEALQRALGYGNRAMLLVSNYNVPTQVLTCLWEDGIYDGLPWQPLLRRRKKK